MKTKALAFTALLALASSPSFADYDDYVESMYWGHHQRNACHMLPSHDVLEAALINSVSASGGPSNGGLDFHMWGTIVANDGTVCAVVKTGQGINNQWLGSRIISAQKANTANAFSLQDGLALSTANLFSAVQPGGSLYRLQFSNPVDASVAYAGKSRFYGSHRDPLRGKKVGGVNVFGGGLALYDETGNLLGAFRREWGYFLC